MNRLKTEKQIEVLKLLVEGNSVRGIERITGVHRDTIIRLMIRVGDNCAEVMDRKMRNLRSTAIEVDEQWSYVYKKQRQLRDDERNTEKGDQFVFVALDADTKLIPCFQVGKRTEENARDFIEELQRRVVGNFQLTTDAYHGYRNIDTIGFRRRVSYATLTKRFRSNGSDPNCESYSPKTLVSLTPNVVCGDPKPDRVSTSYIERQNLTVRMHLRRFARMTNAFSKTLVSLKAALSIWFWHYNFIREHRTLRMTPAMASGVCTSFLSWDDVINKAN